ncbi:MAG: thioredoxin family protein [Actinomycetaceae bacterium]
MTSSPDTHRGPSGAAVARADADATVPGTAVARADADATVLGADELGLRHPLGERATLLQFSSNFCAPCRSTRGLLGWVAEHEPGVRHVELEVTRHLEIAERLGIELTPTFFVLDPDGVVLARQDDVPRLSAVRELLDRLVPAGG